MGREMKERKSEQKLTTVGFVADLQADWNEHGKEVIEELRTEAPAKYAEILGRLAVAERLSPAEKIDFNEAKSMRDIGLKLLQSVGFSEPDEDSVQAAIKANDDFIAKLEAIRDRAAQEGIH